MTAPLIAYDRTVLVNEKDILDLKKEALFAAFPDVPLACLGVDASEGRAIRVVHFHKRGHALAQIGVDTLAATDTGTLQNRLAAGEFAVTS